MIAEVKSRAGRVRFEVRDRTEWIQQNWVKGRLYEGGMLDWIRRHWHGGTFIDCGSNLGNHSVYFAKFCADRVLSVEPVPSSVKHQRANLKLNKVDPRVILAPVALSSKTGTGAMRDASGAHNNSGMYQLDQGEGVNVTTLDALVAQYDLQDVTLVKVDVEHLELAVLQGARSLLQEQRPALFVEVSPENHDEIVALLRRYGYRVRSQHNPSPTFEFIPGKVESLSILHLSEFDFAACGYYLSQAINEHTVHTSRAVRLKSMRIAFPGDIVAPSMARLRSLWDAADVVHLHDIGPVEGLPAKPTVSTWHGSAYRKRPAHFNKMARAGGWVGTVSTLDLTRHGLEWMPDCRPDLSRYVDPAAEFLVVHAPAHRRHKGTDRVIAACDAARVELDLVEGVPHQTCLERKGRAHVLVDQFELGPGCNAIEAWSMGIPVIADAADWHLQLLEDRYGAVPFLRPDPSLSDTLVQVRDSLQRLQSGEIAIAGTQVLARAGWHSWNDLHSPEACASRALAFYDRARTVRTGRVAVGVRWPPKGQRRNLSTRVLRYLATGQGRQSWHPPNGTGVRYEFDGQGPRYVYEPDVQWFLELRGKRDEKLFEEM